MTLLDIGRYHSSMAEGQNFFSGTKTCTSVLLKVYSHTLDVVESFLMFLYDFM